MNNMNTILQKRIEEAAEEYANSTTSNLLNVFETTGRFEGFNQGATFALQNQWISVDEALPDESGEYFVSNGARFREADYDAELHYWVNEPFLGCKFGSEDVTHWTPIPELPKGDEK